LPSYQPGGGVVEICLGSFVFLVLIACLLVRVLEVAGQRRTVLLHDVQEADDDLGGRTDQDLALASLLGVVDGVERIVQDGGLHLGECVVRRFSSGEAAKGIYSRDVSLQEPS
jgi:hypothetical protein